MEDNRTPKRVIVAALRKLWLHSYERSHAVKRDGYSCVNCHVKQSKAAGREQKIQVHHKEGICNWDDIIEAIQKNLLCDPEHLETLCPDCHRER